MHVVHRSPSPFAPLADDERSSVDAGYWTGSDPCGVSDREETNVRIPQCAWDALAVIAAVRRVSRDEAVRQVLDEHVNLQEKRDPRDRRTHISTVLRYPPAPRYREGTKVWPGAAIAVG